MLRVESHLETAVLINALDIDGSAAVDLDARNQQRTPKASTIEERQLIRCHELRHAYLKQWVISNERKNVGSPR